MPYPQGGWVTSACCSGAQPDQSLVLKDIDVQKRGNDLPKVESSTSKLDDSASASMSPCGPEVTTGDWERLRDELTSSLQSILGEWSNQQASLLSRALDDLSTQVASNAAAYAESFSTRRTRRRGRRFAKPLVLVEEEEAIDENEERRLQPWAWSEFSTQSAANKRLDRGDSFSSDKSPKFMTRSPSGDTTTSGVERWLPSLPAWMVSRANSQGYYKSKLWAFFEDPESGRCAAWYANCIQSFILLTVAFSLLQQTTQSLRPDWHMVLLEAVIDGCFALDLLLRFCVCPNRLKFLCNAYNLIDMVASVPLWFHIDMALRTSSMDARIAAFVPILRLLKTLRRFKEFHLLLAAFQRSLEALPVLLFFYCVLLLFFGAFVYAVEPLGNVESLSQALWLTVVSMTTVGYGDVIPMTAQGRIVVVVLVVTSALYMAVPLGIIGNCFSDVWRDRERILLLHVLRTRLSQWGYSPYDIPVMFDHFDKDKDGDLDFQEFHALLDALRIGMREDKIIKLFDELSEREGTVDSADFVKSLFPSSFHEMYDKDGELVSQKQTSWLKMATASFSPQCNTIPEQPSNSSTISEQHSPVAVDE
eukprot:TRINITY_DN9588_c0_g2_i1.p1 TRINITY_DN9588_c0_g2~~TRINITY_DN9588_c0_g2_i1.p1  ORF type:complete len:590 (+),score=69.08 TRINITY_DN9588_c0_g2_i1:69-1838(+)